MAAPLFILCTGRSFSSVACSMFGQHPQMFGLPEVNLFMTDTLGEMYRRATTKNLRHTLHGLVRTIAELHHGEQSEASAAAAWRWVEEHAEWSTARTFHYLCDRVAPRICVDKSPSTVGRPQRLERLLQAFPEARILHMTRHPVAVGKSLYRANMGLMAVGVRRGEADPHRAESHWLDTQRNIMALTDQLSPGQWLRLRGEELVADPDTYLRQLCQWLGIRDDEAAIEAMKHPENSPFACVGPPNARFGNNGDFLRRPHLRIGRPGTPHLDARLPWHDEECYLRAETVELARQLGYR